jgi:hypothetical protein
MKSDSMEIKIMPDFSVRIVFEDFLKYFQLKLFRTIWRKFLKNMIVAYNLSSFSGTIC